MSWLFSRVLVEDCLGRNRLDSTASALLNWIGTADAFSHSDRMSDTYEVFSRYGMTFAPLTAERGAGELILCLEDSLAKHLVQRHVEGITLQTFGLKCSE